MARTATEVRSALVDTLKIDLIGPDNAHPFARELLERSPIVWYLTGFLAPSGAKAEARCDTSPEADEELDAGGDRTGGDDETQPDKGPKRRGLFPVSMGLSVLVPKGVSTLSAHVAWGDYASKSEDDEESAGDGEAGEEGASDSNSAKRRKGPPPWRREPRDEDVDLSIPTVVTGPTTTAIPGSRGLVLVVTVRDLGPGVARMPAGTRAVSVFVVNQRAAPEKQSVESFAFQVELRLACAQGFVGRADPRGCDRDSVDSDERVADLHYRDIVDYAVGHATSAAATVDADGTCRSVWTTWLPTADVERVVPSTTSGVETSMERLGALPDAAAARAALEPLVVSYRGWIAQQEKDAAKLDAARANVGKGLAQEAEWAADRIEAGIALLADPLVLEAFRIANRAMARQARRRRVIERQRTIDEATAAEPHWRPFQLAFFLAVMRGLAEPEHSEREVVDLLFFPTGGGKTEAYLGLAAFAMVLRRLRDPSPTSAGVCVLMRYTLRLLTLDQLGRATTLMCALELEREAAPAELGTWPFEIGLWVGRAATPNRMGRAGDGDENSARARTLRYQSNSGRTGAPIPLENCPWCGVKFEPGSFQLIGPAKQPTNLAVRCVDLKCDFNGTRMLPIVSVDEPLYRRLPAFVIATVDKFASLPWSGQAGALFGRVDRQDNEGFYGAADPQLGRALGRQLPPPDLIIQDELHLISGPLGTIAGVYETAIDALCARESDGKSIRPKIVASTATVRRAAPQIRALFGRASVAVFPPPGINRADSFFAQTVPASQKPARMYVGVAAPGRSLKVVFLRASLALASAAQRELDAGGDADAYLTLVGYFNSLRELGGSRRIVEDEIGPRVKHYARRRRLEPVDDTFVNRVIQPGVLELTSRVLTNDVAEAKRRLALPFSKPERVDVALATNMISVGLDIQRLGLMLVLGQPKSSAEYIQATSRVGRDENKPGLVVTLLNPHKPRDRSHFERFTVFHTSFYRSVEATSVTPFSPRALDRALAATLVAMCRHGEKQLTAPSGAAAMRSVRIHMDKWVDVIAERARNHGAGPQAELDRLADTVRARGRKLLDDWVAIATDAAGSGSGVQYNAAEVKGINRHLLHDFLDVELDKLMPEYRSFRAARSMRDVEPTCDLIVRDLM